MRDIYYQPVGNPLQLDRLPATQPTMQSLPPAADPGQTFSQATGPFVVAAGLALAALVLYRPPGLSWLEPYDLLLAVPTVFWGLGAATFLGHTRWLLHPCFLAAVGLLALNHRMPWPGLVLILSTALGLLAYSFGRHWIAVCTAAPMRRSSSATLRLQWRLELLVLASIAGLATGATLGFGIPLLKWVLLTLPLVADARPPLLTVSRPPDGES